MEIRNLLSFRKICELNSFSKAAAELGYSQSTITMQIKQLETELQVQLFDRIGKAVHLSDDGRQFLTYANDIIMTADNARQALSKNAPPYGELRIGVLESVCTAYLPDVLKKLHMECPQVSTIISIGTLDHLSAMLNANTIDVFWTFDLPIERKEWTQVYSYENDICVIASPDNRLAISSELTLADISMETFLLTEQNCSYRTVFDNKMRQLGFQPAVFLEIGNTEIIKKFVSANLGISVLPRFTVRDELISKKIVCLDIQDFSIKMKGQLFIHKNKWLTSGIKAFVDISKSILDNIKNP